MTLKTLAFVLPFIAISAFAQEEAHSAAKHAANDSNCLEACIAKAHWSAHTRTFFMSTINEGGLKDDYALGFGAGIGVLTKPLHGFQAGMSGFFIYNVASSRIHDADPLTQAPNRYEVGLFDIEDHENKNDLDRLEELFLKYSYSKSSITLGKMILNTPFMNPQDGRMRPTIEEGVWLTVNESSKFGLSGGWIWDVSPRSTIKWYSVAHSIGVYPGGVTAEGRKSEYAGNIEGNSGMGIINLSYKPSEHLKINVWNGFLENVMNSALIEFNAERKKGRKTYYQDMLFMHQDALNNGGNADATKTYIDKGAQSNAFSIRAGVKDKKFNNSVSYTHITGDGRYLMPREWGKEVFYTFMPRERIEGYGNVHALMVRSNWTVNSRFQTALAYSYVQLPDVRDYRLNKYGMPSYHQINYSANYTFDKFLRGMDFKLLVAYKLQQGETYGNLKYVYNKVNMLNLNLVMDFKI